MLDNEVFLVIYLLISTHVIYDISILVPECPCVISLWSKTVS